MKKTKTGIEMGIRADMSKIIAGYDLAEAHGIDHYFVPETVPEILGVDAFAAMARIAKDDQPLKIGTGIVSVYSRPKHEMMNRAKQLSEKTSGNFVLGIGTSIKKFAEVYNQKFTNQTGRMMEYTDAAKKLDIPVYWGSSNDNMVSLSGKLADGVIFFMKPESEVKRSVDIVEKSIDRSGRDRRDFNIVTIRPTFPDYDTERAKKRAKITVANYIIGNPAYTPSLVKAGFKDEIDEIKKFMDGRQAYEKVSDNLSRKLAVYGTPSSCSETLHYYSDRVGVDTVVAGFDLHKNEYTHEVMDNIKKFVKYMGK